MRTILFIFLFLYTNICFAKTNLPLQEWAIQMAWQNIQNKNVTELELIYKNQTENTEHFTFQCKVNKLDVWGWKIKINATKKEGVSSIYNQTPNNNFIIQESSLFTHKIIANPNLKKIYFPTNEFILVPAFLQTIQKSSTDSIIIYDENNTVLFVQNNARYLKKDTVLHVKIFNPDPLTSAKSVYGNTKKDAGDSTKTWLENEQIWKTVKGKFDDTTKKFYLENNNAIIQEFSLPTTAVTIGIKDSFNFTRNESSFEDVNVFYHISTFHNYLQQLGYGGLLPEQIQVDAHAQNGADNSVFLKNGGIPKLELGTGGVDDGEDADVIIHEYSHGISWSANNNIIGANTERSAIEEGVADYFATSYSRRIDTFGWQKMFSWDGHNEFWNGRSANTNNNLTLPFNGLIYEGGEILNCALQKIWTAVGASITDKLVLQTLFSLADETTFTQVANEVLIADSILFNYTHKQIICDAFISKNIIPTIGCTNAIPPVDTTSFALQIIKSNGVTIPTITSSIKKAFAYNVYNILGQKISAAENIFANLLEIDTKELPRGNYIIVVLQNDLKKSAIFTVE